MNTQLPNFIVFLVDDQAWSGTSVHKYHPYRMDSRSDYFEMPNLDRLAREGIRFTDMYAPAPLCAPARISIQLGRSPVTLRATTFCGIRRGDKIEQKRDRHMRSIPELIKREHPEYATAHFGKWHIYGHMPDFLQVSHYALHTPTECRPEVRQKFEAERPGWKDHDPTCYEPAIAYDLLPTIADILEIKKLPKGIEGTSLQAAFTHPPHKFQRTLDRQPAKPILQRAQDYFVWHLPYRVQGYSYYRESAIRRGKYKLIKNWDGDFLELYDLEVDLEEQVNLVSQKPALAQKLETLRLDHLQQVDAEMDYAPFGSELWKRWQQEDRALNQ